MPRFDRTGPNGQGSMTGRGAGYCAPAGVRNSNSLIGRPRFGMRNGQGRGRGMGRGMGRGRNRR